MARQVYAGEGMRIIKLRSGEDVLRGLEGELARLGVRDGVIVAGIGSTTGAHVHVVETTKLPPGDKFFRHENEPFDIVSLQGYVMAGRVHAHIALARMADAAQLGGHLEEGCPVLTFCLVTVVPTAPLGDQDTFAGQK